MKRLQPKLRFKEFSGDWEEKKLKEVSSKIGSGNTPKGGNEVYTNEGIIFIRSQNINKNRLILNNVAYIPERINNNMKGSIVKANDVLLNITGASIGRSCVVPSKFKIGNVNQHVCIIRLRSDSPLFIQTLLSSSIGQKLIFQSQTGSGREGLNFQNIGGFKVKLPSLAEQEKIALFISSIDDKIQKLEGKKEKLEEYKKGIMQRIFSVGKNSINNYELITNNYRFKPTSPEDIEKYGENYPDWEEKKLGEVTTIFGRIGYKGYTVQDIVSQNEGGAIALSPSNIKNGKLSLEKKTYISNFKYEESPEIKIFNGDIIFVKTSSVGLTAFIENLNEEATLNPQMIVFKKVKGVNRFYSYYFNHSGFQKAIKRISAGGVLQTLSQKEMAKLELNIPCLEEQEKIADFLSSVDEKIEKVGGEIERMKEYKKGLLQGMFV